MQFVLVDKNIKKLVEENIIYCNYSDLVDFIQPSSIDIPLGEVAYKLKYPINTTDTTVENSLKDNIMEKFDLNDNVIFEKNNTYIVPTIHLNLNKQIFAKASPKSSIGRIDVFVRSLIDNCGLYDIVPSGFKGRLWLEITPQSFNIKVKKNIPITQLKFFVEDRNKKLNKPVIKIYEDLPFIEKDHELLSLYVGTHKDTGYEAINTTEVIDLNSTSNNSKLFFKPISNISNGSLLLKKDHFYLLRTFEKLSFNKHFSGEMLPYSNLFGELRIHYAGYFDPGFGYFENSVEQGNYGVLEIRPYENTLVRNKQPVCFMRYLHNYDVPKRIYNNKNNYTQQLSVKLAKFFKEE